MDYSRRDRADALAADYVTGTLRGAARRRFEALLAVHPTLRDAVQAWQARLMPMTLSVEPVEPSPQVWQRIEARIHQAAAEPGPTGRWQRLAFWRGLAGVASAASLAMAVLVALPDPVLPPIVVVLNPTDAAGAAPSTIIASLSGDRRALVARPLQTVALQPDRVLELWALPAEGAPR